MNRCSILCVAALTAVAGTLAIAQPAKDKPATKPTAAPAAQPEVKPALPDATPKMDMQLPPGFTPEMMKACMDAATPGPMHELMAKHRAHQDREPRDRQEHPGRAIQHARSQGRVPRHGALRGLRDLGL